MDDIPMKRNRRSGGRSARKLKRAAPIPSVSYTNLTLPKMNKV